MSETTTVLWGFRIGQRVRWMGDGQVCSIHARRWVERPVLAPLAEYQISRPSIHARLFWVIEADLAPADEAGEGEG